MVYHPAVYLVWSISQGKFHYIRNNAGKSPMIRLMREYIKLWGRLTLSFIPYYFVQPAVFLDDAKYDYESKGCSKYGYRRKQQLLRTCQYFYWHLYDIKRWWLFSAKSEKPALYKYLYYFLYLHTLTYISFSACLN